jgi:flagellar protein FliS
METMAHVQTQLLEHYRRVDVHSGVEGASPHRLVGMLLNGALARIAAAAGHMERGEVAAKGESIGSAISIIDGLRGCLNLEAPGNLAENLAILYDYMIRSLVDANYRNDTAMLDETRSLLAGIKTAWEAIEAQTDGAETPTPVGVER